MQDRDTAATKSSLAARMVRTTLTILGGIAVGLLGTGGTYAYLNASASSSSAATISAGNAALSVPNAPVSLGTFHPGLTQRSQFTVMNTGTVPLTLSVASVTSSVPASQLVAGVANGDCSTSPASGQTSGSLPGVLAAGQTRTLCLVVSLPVGATLDAAGKSTTLAVTVSGVQS